MSTPGNLIGHFQGVPIYEQTPEEQERIAGQWFTVWANNRARWDRYRASLRITLSHRDKYHRHRLRPGGRPRHR